MIVWEGVRGGEGAKHVAHGGGHQLPPRTSQSAQPHRHTELVHMVVGEEVLPV